MEKDQRLVYSILEYLEGCIEKGIVKKDDAESMQVAVQCISESFQVDTKNPEHQKKFSTKPASLMSIFEVYLNAQKKVSSPSAAPTGSSSSSVDAKKEADELKAKGNSKLSEKKFEEAIEFYSQAIDLYSAEPVYYSNRAAAYSQINQHEKAVADCESALKIDANYSKAYSRLGLAKFGLCEYADAVDAYKKAIELEPSNESYKQSLRTAEGKLKESSRSPAAPGFGMPSGAGGAPGGLDFASLMSNPAIMNMAQQFMSNPQMAGLAQNLANGNGNMSDLLGNPNIMNMAQQLMQDPNMADMLKDPGMQDMLKNFKK